MGLEVPSVEYPEGEIRCRVHRTGNGGIRYNIKVRGVGYAV
jgi:hypothetical protein